MRNEREGGSDVSLAIAGDATQKNKEKKKERKVERTSFLQKFNYPIVGLKYARTAPNQMNSTRKPSLSISSEIKSRKEDYEEDEISLEVSCL